LNNHIPSCCCAAAVFYFSQGLRKNMQGLLTLFVIPGAGMLVKEIKSLPAALQQRSFIFA
jgi:hypothetical protein